MSIFRNFPFGVTHAANLQNGVRFFGKLLLGYSAVAVIGSSAFISLRTYQAHEWKTQNPQIEKPMRVPRIEELMRAPQVDEPVRALPLEEKRQRSPGNELVAVVGDEIRITIFEAAAGGLSVPQEAGVRAGNFITLPSQVLDSSGYILVPYAGKILALGRSSKEIQRDIERAIANRAIDPQVVVTIIRK